MAPRVGEEVTIPYFREIVKTDHFYVRSIHHEFTDTNQVVYVSIVVGQYNRYWNMKRDEEYAKGRMSMNDYLSKDESRIRKGYGLRWL
ncbi:hypothetical protein ACUNWD_14770 [Sunxiuqinia sp. A32]|uniref:hypothetical protein n=1 Tax=Sunxiuqinia sp. A32 TaxID=3461496 RepID=UPI00404653E6